MIEKKEPNDKIGNEIFGKLKEVKELLRKQNFGFNVKSEKINDAVGDFLYSIGWEDAKDLKYIKLESIIDTIDNVNEKCDIEVHFHKDGRRSISILTEGELVDLYEANGKLVHSKSSPEANSVEIYEIIHTVEDQDLVISRKSKGSVEMEKDSYWCAVGENFCLSKLEWSQYPEKSTYFNHKKIEDFSPSGMAMKLATEAREITTSRVLHKFIELECNNEENVL